MRARSWLPCVLVIAGISVSACRQQAEPPAPAASGATADTANTAPAPSTQAIREAAKEAYLFGYPLVLMDATRAVMTNVPEAMSDAAPVNQMFHKRTFPDASFTNVVSPNADTLYSTAWLDVGKEPMVLSVPDTKGRYYLMPMLDAWTNVFASPGKRTTGTAKGDFAIVGPQWTGTLPAGVKEIKAPTSMVWIAGRTQTNGKADFPAVNALQDQIKLTPLSAWGKPYSPPKAVPVDAALDMKTSPVDALDKMDAAAFFNRLAALMRDNPPAPADKAMVDKLVSLGVVAGQAFDPSKLGPEGSEAISQGVAEAKSGMAALGHKLPNASVENGWQTALRDVGSYGTNYLVRAGVAWVGLGANLPQDAVYPLARTDVDGQPLNGANKYVIHFDKGNTPPVDAFWSLTMYNDKQSFVANPINRFAIGDRDRLKFNDDGSLDIYIQHDSPGKDKEANWLPANAGPFNLAMRLYWPKESVLSGAWTPPPVTKVAK